jgi:hypothetical protein
MDQKTPDKGLEIRKAVLGEAYVNNALKNADGFNKPFQELVTEYCWGAVWGRDELPRKTRSMLNLAAKRSNPPRRIKNEWIASTFALRATADKSSLRSSQ